MRAPFAYAFGNARVRAMKSRLRTGEDLRIFRAAASPSALAAAAGVEPPRRPEDLARVPFADLLADYRNLVDAYSAGAPLFRALLDLHEVDNLKLAWSACARALPASRWMHLWKALGALETLPLARVRDAASLRGLVAAARGTPYERIAAEVFRAHGDDGAAAQLAFDRWAWSGLLAQARRLPHRESGAADLLLSRVRERDFDLLRRAPISFGFSAEAAAAATVLLREETDAEQLRRLAAWSPASGPLARDLPRSVSRRLEAVAFSDWDEFLSALRRERRRQCLRAFRGYPFRLAPPVAYLLLREAEVSSLRALAESRGMPEPNPALDRVLAASAMDAG